MNQQEQATQHAAIFQDTINGTNDPTPWPVTMWASSGDTIWTAGTARTAGEDSVGMIYDPGDTIVHRNTIAGDVTRATESFAIRPADGQSPMDAMLAGIEQWNHRHPDRWDTVATPGQYRMTDPTTGRQLPMGWSASLAAAASAAGRLDPDLLQASLMQNAVEHEPRPCVFFLEDNGYDLMVFSWHRNQQGLFDAMSFKHLQYDDLSMQVTTISHSEDMSESFPAKTMSDGELLTQSRVYRDEYQHWREQDGGPVAQGMTGRVMRSGLLKPGLEQKPLLNLNDGRRAPDWDEFTDQAAISILQGQPISPTPALPQQEQPERDTDPTAVTQTPARTAAATKQARSKTTDRPTVEQYVPEGGKTPDAIGDETPAPPRKTETDMATKQRQDPIVPASQSPAAGPERRHTDLKSTLDRFRTRLKKNLDGLNADPPTAGTDRNRGQRKTL